MKKFTTEMTTKHQKAKGIGGGLGLFIVIVSTSTKYGPGLLIAICFSDDKLTKRKFGSEHIARQARTSRYFRAVQLTAM